LKNQVVISSARINYLSISRMENRAWKIRTSNIQIVNYYMLIVKEAIYYDCGPLFPKKRQLPRRECYYIRKNAICEYNFNSSHKNFSIFFPKGGNQSTRMIIAKNAPEFKQKKIIP
jgi:hypothetical protein